MTPAPAPREGGDPPAGEVVCHRCGATADGPATAWTCSVENGRRRYFCDRCARDNLRSIESRLDSAWW
ncbi:hypothetical protein [Streptomyces sp. ODS05-4]|uniref:hypothetical protein n=1 Tax=Streptomyces sp. ODS05-4 TaxID=2944939 RepID=UPI00210E6CBF|nr:hypothetical protein [Streptomyces sp. ODS05-4]